MSAPKPPLQKADIEKKGDLGEKVGHLDREGEA